MYYDFVYYTLIWKTVAYSHAAGMKNESPMIAGKAKER